MEDSRLRTRSLGCGLGCALAVLMAGGCGDGRLPDLGPLLHHGGGGKADAGISADAGATSPVAWKTETVSFVADDFWIIADGQRFSATGIDVSLHSDPGDPTYTTLEVIWMQNQREMRLNIYFHSDGTRWWSDEIRTYNAQISGDWLFYHRTFFESPVGVPFRGTIDVVNDPSDAIRGELHIHGLVLATTLG